MAATDCDCTRRSATRWRSRRSRNDRALGGGRLGGGVYDCDHLLSHDGRAIGLANLGDYAGIRSRQFQNNLVSLDIDEIFIAPDRLARLFVPVDERRFRNRFRQHGNFDLDEHERAFVLINGR